MSLAKPSEQVKRIAEAWDGTLAGPFVIRFFPIGDRSVMVLNAGDPMREVQFCVSPKGRSVRVWVDGKEVKP